jgi:hypothetical protein
MGGGDTEFFRRAHARGHGLVYLPTLVVRHLVPASRVTRAFFRERLLYSGYTRAAVGTEGPARIGLNCAMFGVGSALCALAAAALRLAGRPAASFAQERRMLLGAGYLYYWMLRAAGRVPSPRLEVWTS